MQLITVKIEKPANTNFILGQTQFIKSVEDIQGVLVAAVPGIKFGLAFCESSGKCLERRSGTELHRRNRPRQVPCLICKSKAYEETATLPAFPQTNSIMPHSQPTLNRSE